MSHRSKPHQGSVHYMITVDCKRLLPVAALTMLAMPLAHGADIFRCPGPDGQPVFQQQPCGKSDLVLTAPPTETPTTVLPDSSTDSGAQARCAQVADAVRNIGLGFQNGESERVLRQRLNGTIDPDSLQQAFRAFQFGRSVPTEELAAFSQLVCDTRAALPPPQPWHLSKNAATIQLHGWQQIWKWPSSWRLVGIRDRPDFQIDLAYADFDATHLRVGCRAHDSGMRLDGLGHQLLATWAEAIQAGASQPRHAANPHPGNFGEQEIRDADSKRLLFAANLPPPATGATDNYLLRRSQPPRVSVAITPQRLCVAVHSGAGGTDTAAREASTMVELLLTNKPSPFQ
ncbi:MAG: DUF4124 domain-containing protein [Pseudomonadota bacterium]